MKYLGIRSRGQVPDYAASTELSHTEQHGSKTVEYYHVWLNDPDTLPPPFKENEEPKPSKIRALSEFLGIKIK